MATETHVSDALADLVVAALYPTDPNTSAVGHDVKVYAGWPDPGTVDADMVEQGGLPLASHVSIWPAPGTDRNVTRYQGRRVTDPLPAPTYTLTAAGLVVTVGGAAPNPYSPQNLAIVVAGVAYVVTATAGQTPDQVAAALGAKLSLAIFGVIVAGPAIILPTGARLDAVRVGITGTTKREVRRQQKQWWISTWSSNPATRALVSDSFDAQLSDAAFLTLADGSQAHVVFHGARDDDFTQKQRVYRRTLVFVVEFPTVITETATQIVAALALFPEIELVDAAGNIISGLDFSVAENSGFLPGL